MNLPKMALILPRSKDADKGGMVQFDEAVRHVSAPCITGTVGEGVVRIALTDLAVTNSWIED